MYSLRLAPLLLSCSLVHAVPVDWNAVARQDMQFAIDTIRSSHAGAVSGQVDVVAALDDGGRAGLAEANTVKNERDYRRAMLHFISGFGDPHTAVNVGLAIAAWTGIVIDRTDGQFRVVWSEPGWPHPLPPRGAIVDSCDGVWIGTWLKTRVAPFINLSGEYAASASEAAWQSMYDNGLGWAPQACTFTIAAGKTRSYPLPLRAVADGIGAGRIAQVRALYQAKARPVGLYALAPGMHWVGMPDFNGSTSGPAYEVLYPKLAALKTAQWVVFDLRGNGGGDSTWGNRALQALYGRAYGERLGEAASYEKRLIANQATIGVYQRYVSLPEFAASKNDMEATVRTLQQAVARGDKMARESGSTREAAAALMDQLRQRPGGPRIAAVIDRRCFSSCMNFLQQVSAIGDTVVLGEATNGYSPYGEIDAIKLPSGLGTLRLPTAIYTAFQATRAPFVPDLPYAGNLADDTALMAWVATRLAALAPGARQ